MLANFKLDGAAPLELYEILSFMKARRTKNII